MAARIPNGDSIEKSPTPLPEWRMEAARGDGTSHWTPRHIQTGNTRSYRRYRELLPARICVHMAPVAPRDGKKSRTGRPDRVRTGGMSGGQGGRTGRTAPLSGRTGRQTGGLSGPCPVGQGAVLAFWPPCPIPPKMAFLHQKQFHPPIWHMENTLQHKAWKFWPWWPISKKPGTEGGHSNLSCLATRHR